MIVNVFKKAELNSTKKIKILKLSYFMRRKENEK
jgi:hypothetical protein